MSLFKKWVQLFCPNPFDHLLKRAAQAGKKRFLVIWNRGLGDIPLGLYALIDRIRRTIPQASITFLTRKDLADLFQLLEDVKVIVGDGMVRGKPVEIDSLLKKKHLSANLFDVILESPNPTRWLKWQLGTLTPKLAWNPDWDQSVSRYSLPSENVYIGCHVQTETSAYYGYEKNWPLPYWRSLFKKIHAQSKGIILLFGKKKDPAFLMEGVIDLRGETTLFEMLSLIKNRCSYLIAPDSGVLSVTYYLDASYPIRVVSLWADQKQGVLRQNVSSPNPHLEHVPLCGKKKTLSSISVDRVYDTLFTS